MFDLESKCRLLRLSWIHKYLRCEKSARKILVKYWIQKVGDLLLCLHFICKKSDMYRICRKSNIFYNVMLEQNKQDLPCIYFWNAYFDLHNEFNWKTVLHYKFYLINDNKIKDKL